MYWNISKQELYLSTVCDSCAGYLLVTNSYSTEAFFVCDWLISSIYDIHCALECFQLNVNTFFSFFVLSYTVLLPKAEFEWRNPCNMSKSFYILNKQQRWGWDHNFKFKVFQNINFFPQNQVFAVYQFSCKYIGQGCHTSWHPNPESTKSWHLNNLGKGAMIYGFLWSFQGRQ